MFKFRYLFFLLFFLTVSQKAQAELNVIDTEFFHKITIDTVNLTLVDWDKSIKQWVVNWQANNGIYELGLYPSNSMPSFSLNSHQSWLFSTDQDNWQVLDDNKFTANKVYLKKNDLGLGFDSHLLPRDKNVSVDISDFFDYDLPENLQLISKVYRVESAEENLNLDFYHNSSNDWHKQVYAYNPSSATWSKLNGYHNVEEKYIKLSLKDVVAPVYLAIFEDNQSHDGIASFYDQSRYRSFGNKNGLFAASRYYPKGTKLKVTRLLTGKSIIVTVNDYGPESRTGRLIDLDKYAFKQIASLGAGIIYVKVEPI